MVRLVLVLRGLLAANLLFSLPAHAQTLEQRQRCDGIDGAPPDQRIGGCTAIIEAGNATSSYLPRAFYHRGTAYFNQGQPALALQDLDRAISLDPHNPHAFNNRGSVYNTLNQHDRAIQDFDQAIKLDPKYAHAFFNRANAYSDQGQHDRAIKDLDEAIGLDPNYGSAFNNRCLNRAQIGQFLEALADCNSALMLRPNRGRATTLTVRGITYLKMQQFDLAIADFDAALKLSPRNASSLFERGVAKLKKGDATGGNADILAAKAIQADVADELRRYAVP